MSNFISQWLDRILNRRAATGRGSALATPNGSRAARASANNGEEYLQSIRQKLDLLADDFANGRINRAQYEELYGHYQNQRRVIENLQGAFGNPEEARQAVVEGRSLVIRRQNQAEVVAFAIYANESSAPLFTYGQFLMDSALVVGMLSGLRDASREMLGASLRKTEVEDGKVLCFVGGARTTLLVLYSIDPSPKQLEAVKQVHQDFENTNRALLEQPQFDPVDLFVPVGRIIGIGPSLRQLAGA